MDGPNKGDGPQADELDKGGHTILMWHPPGFSDLQGILMETTCVSRLTLAYRVPIQIDS